MLREFGQGEPFGKKIGLDEALIKSYIKNLSACSSVG
jgi:hypothetical protein